MGADVVQLTSDTYQTQILNGPKKQGAFVAFFNMDPDEGCKPCEERREIWKMAATNIKKNKKLNDIVFAHIDQSANEHQENRVAQRLSEPVIVWYPPGSPKRRWKGRSFLHDISLDWTEEELPEKLLNFIEDQMD